MYQRAKYKENVSWEDIENPIASRKFDGAHYFVKVGPTGNLSFISRRESVKGGFPDRSDKLPHLTSTPLPQFAGDVYSVELIHTGHNKNALESHPASSGILNSLPAKAIETQKMTGPIRAVLLDVVHPQLPTYRDKILHLAKVQEALANPELVYLPEFHVGKEAISSEIARTKNNNEEGVIITSLTKPESINVRVKIKHKKTYNLKVIGITQEFDIHGNPKDSAGALIVADSTGREVGNVGTGFTRELRREIFANKGKWMGRLIQVVAMDSTGTRLRSPVYNGLADGELDAVN